MAACGEDAPSTIPVISDGGGGSGGAGGGSATEGIVSSSSQSDLETDPQIALGASGAAAVVWTGRTDGGESHIGYAFSTDGGKTWTAPGKVASDTGASYQSADVVVDGFGNFFLTFLADSRNATGGTVFVAKGTGGSFEAPEAITDTENVGFYGRPRIAITNSGRLLVTHTTVDSGVGRLTAATRGPNDAEWVSKVLTTDNQSHYSPHACTAEQTLDGRSYLVDSSQGRIFLRRTEDNGDTWQLTEAVDADDIGKVSSPPSCVAIADDVWVQYGVRGSVSLKSIRVGHSTDGGVTFDTWATISDPELPNNYATHQIALQAPNTAHALYYAAAGSGDRAASVQRVSFGPSDLTQDPPVNPGDPIGMTSTPVLKPVTFETQGISEQWIGSTVGLAMGQSGLLMAYVDNSSGRSHIAVKIAAP